MIIPGFSDYDISEDGVVTFAETGIVVKPHIARTGYSEYLRVSLRCQDGITRAYNVLTLLAYTYLHKTSRDGVAVAKDGNNLNAVLSNVEWHTRSELAKHMWSNGNIKNRRPRQCCYNADSIEMVYNALCAYDEPVTMTELSSTLEVPYSTIRYSIVDLRKVGKVRKTKDGFEVIK